MTLDHLRPFAHRALTWAVRLATVGAPLAFGGFLIGSLGGDGSTAEAGVAPVRPLRAERPVTTHTLRPGETLEDLLRRGDLGDREVRRLIDLTRPHTDWRRPHPVTTARFHAWPGEAPERIDLVVDRDRTVRLEVEGAVWTASVAEVAVRLDTVVVTGDVDASLWAARLGGDASRLTTEEKADLAGRLADVFAWQLDFFRDVRPGDRYRLALQREVRPDGSTRSATVLAAEYATGDSVLSALRFSPSDEAGAFYYDRMGSSLRGPFLKAPLDLVRITSRFSNQRFHPTLGRYRAHQGVDYGAAAGTPVRATGDGTVRRAGLAGDYGLLVEIDHPGGIRTRYAHLSGVANGIAAGAAVTQGDVIGAVGSSGLATGPHLHYEFLKAGAAVDPSSVDLPVERPLPEVDAERFARQRAVAEALLDRAESETAARSVGGRETA